MTVYEDGTAQDANDVAGPWRERLKQAIDDRRRYEPTWLSNLAFAAGKHWLQWNPASRQLQMPTDMPWREVYTADIITEYRSTVLGEMTGDDRPELLLVQSEEWTRDYQAQANRAIRFAWENEWQADHALAQAKQWCLDLGTSAVRCKFDPNQGPVRQGNVPFQNGRPVLDPEKARGYVADTAASGGIADLRQVREGRTTFEPLSAFNLLVPSGIPHENDLPWEAVVRPVSIDNLMAEYGDVAAGMAEDGDIGSLFGTDSLHAGGETWGSTEPEGGQSKLREHAWLYLIFERPCPKYPDGRVLHLGGKDMRLLRVTPELPYVGADGTRRSGIAYYHWWRVSGRFWSRSMVEALKDPQRMINRRKTQNTEIIDRGMPHLIVEEGALKQTPRGLVMEKIEVKKGSPQPKIDGGTGPGQWMYMDIDELRRDVEHGSGVKSVTLGDNPANVTTYSQLALLNENDQGKRESIYHGHKLATKYLVECGLHAIRQYWPPEKQIMLAVDDDERIQAETFNASRLPDFYVLRVPTGATKPRSQAAELKKIDDIFQRSIDAAQPLPITWYAASIEAGEPLELPQEDGNSQHDKAQLENHVLSAGMELGVQYYDNPEIHIPVHRSSQIAAEISGDEAAWQAHEQHIQQHIVQAAENAAQTAQVEGEQAAHDVKAEEMAAPPEPADARG